MDQTVISSVFYENDQHSFNIHSKETIRVITLSLFFDGSASLICRQNVQKKGEKELLVHQGEEGGSLTRAVKQ